MVRSIFPGFISGRACRGKFIFGSPLFDAATVDVGGGKPLEIKVQNNSADNIYVQRVNFNGESYDKSYIDYERIKNGGVLEFIMGNKPSDTYGTNKESRP